MPRDYMLRIRLNTQELERLKAVAQNRQVSMSEVIRNYIKRLPKPQKKSE
ncbi:MULTISPECIES: DNA-binding protein [Planktothricoides]|uniref:DNA-binding protein n=2 Tax=Planktothricoides raciborskii TaxID=132608 RepID=A0AAU8JF77_9CYAN|nr:MULTISPECIES: DNA-binding protein [Planktothricoides]MBD2544361.1 DNA-binding protein [Planktothricoides raciborskii FACHB-1370]MBD2582208.1 DNA-binding protein [Planktothricoides raciborskii FACHB-1261]